MLKFSGVTALFLVFFSLSSFTSSSLNSEQEELVLQHLQNPIANIEAMREFTLKSLQEDTDFQAIANELPRLIGLEKLAQISETVANYGELNEAQKMFLHAYAAMHIVSFAKLDVREQILRTGKLCALMLSKDNLSLEGREKIRTHSYGLIKQQNGYINKIMDVKAFDSGVAMEQILKLFQQEDTISKSTSVRPLPLVLLPPHNVFSLKTFFFALAQGVSLFGLDGQPFTGHGGVFESPLLAIAHDIGHEEELGEDEALIVLTVFAKGLLAMLEDEVFENPAKALYAAFVLIHETQIKTFASSSPSLAMGKRLNFIFGAVRHRFGESEFEKYEAEFTRAFFSDLAREIIIVQPELENTIFPQGKHEPYDLKATIEAHVKLVNWFKRYFVEEESFMSSGTFSTTVYNKYFK